jgi:hypothetical protein
MVVALSFFVTIGSAGTLIFSIVTEDVAKGFISGLALTLLNKFHPGEGIITPLSEVAYKSLQCIWYQCSKKYLMYGEYLQHCSHNSNNNSQHWHHHQQEQWHSLLPQVMIL